MNAAPTPPKPLTTAAADDMFEMLLDAHAGLSAEESRALNTRLILVLAAELANPARLGACIQAAQAVNTQS